MQLVAKLDYVLALTGLKTDGIMQTFIFLKQKSGTFTKSFNLTSSESFGENNAWTVKIAEGR